MQLTGEMVDQKQIWSPPLIQPDLFWGNDLMMFQRFNTIMKTHLLLSIWRIHLLYRYAPSALFMALSQQPKQLPTACLQHAPLLTLACVLLQSKYSTDWLKWIRNTTLSDMHWMEMLKYIWPWRTSNSDVEIKLIYRHI